MANPFDQEVARQVRRLPRIRANTQREILRQLLIAQRSILAQLAGASPEAAERLGRQRAAIAAAIERWRSGATTAAHAGLGEAWSAGVDLIGKPSDAAGLQLGPRLVIDDRQLRAMRTFMTNRIKDVSTETVNRINTSLAQVIVGTKPMHQAITEIQRQLEGSTRGRAMTIAYTEVGRAYSQASYDAMLAAEQLGVKLGKRWLKSGKLHPRPGHVMAHNQLRRVTESFEVVDPRTGELEKIRFPRDPKASPGNTINCGCMMVPVLDGSTLGASVIDIPDDPKKPIGRITREQRLQQTQDQVARTNDRLARFLQLPASTPGLQVITSSTAKPLLSPERDADMAAQFALWFAKPSGRGVAGVVPSALSRGMAARSAEVAMRTGTRNKQLRRHPDLGSDFYAALPDLLAGYRVAMRQGADTLLVANHEGIAYQLVLRRHQDQQLYLVSAYRLVSRREKVLRTLPVIDGAW